MVPELGCTSSFISLPLWSGLCPLHVSTKLIVQRFQNMVWRLEIVPGTFTYMQNSLQNRGLRARSLTSTKSGIQLPPNSQQHVFLKNIFLYFLKKFKCLGINSYVSQAAPSLPITLYNSVSQHLSQAGPLPSSICKNMYKGQNNKLLGDCWK